MIHSSEPINKLMRHQEHSNEAKKVPNTELANENTVLETNSSRQ